MAIYCESLNLLYVQVPSTGCSVAAVALSRHFGGVQLGRKHSTVPELLQQGLISPADRKRCVTLANIRNPYDRLATYYARFKGPWAISESLRVQEAALAREIGTGQLTKADIYQKQRRFEQSKRRTLRRVRTFRHLGFNTWLWSAICRWQLERFRSSDEQLSRNQIFPMLNDVDIAIRQESLEASLNVVLHRLGESRKIELTRRNLTKEKKPYAEYYNAASRWLMDAVYGEEIKKMGYGFANEMTNRAPVPLSTQGEALLS